ncbi:hypothetical protein [Leptolyngbya iicbica]|uniref:Uncharacterized protein n=2 Tax=Cyanophyceae TaxID=3028117 RepID=A0A4Q7EES6_9CYAN|nr:hypothetical protein [Leptolyngbya sp. LK]RZM82344.1 hypothetical protein DYY88_03600 [Leptolyngbya sp. LK]
MSPLTHFPGCVLQPQLASDRPRRYVHCTLAPRRGDWVTLTQAPQGPPLHKAQLLLPESPTTWIAWMPNHGEIVLDRSQFYC